MTARWDPGEGASRAPARALSRRRSLLSCLLFSCRIVTHADVTLRKRVVTRDICVTLRISCVRWRWWLHAVTRLLRSVTLLTLTRLLLALDILATVIRPVMQLVGDDEARCAQRHRQRIGVAIPLTGIGQVVGSKPRQVAVLGVIERPPPEEVEVSHRLRSRDP